MEKKEVIKADIGSQVITRIEDLCKAGFVMPADFQYVNAIKSALLILADVKNKDKVPALQCCTPQSIQSALFKTCVLGLDPTKKQVYYIVRGTELCAEESYFGICTRAKRISKNFEPIANIIYKGDEFEYEVNPETGRKRIVKHVQKLENIDGEIIGAYAYVTDDNGNTDVEVMTIKMIKQSWAKSSSQGQNVHREFPDQMAKRSVIKRAAKMLLNSSLEKNTILEDDELETEIDASKQIAPVYSEFEEVTETVNQETGEIIQPQTTEGEKRVGRSKKEEVKEEIKDPNIDF